MPTNRPGRLAAPTPLPGGVRRARLLAQVTDGVRHALTVVHGPAGSGKTELLGAWVASEAAPDAGVASGAAPGPIGWVTLDEDAEAPGPFWALALDALATCGVPLGADIGVPAGASVIDRPFLSRVAAAITESSRPVVLVLDDYDAVSPGRVDADLDLVLRDAAPMLGLVLVSRDLPELRLARYRAEGQLTEIGPADLAFRPDEAAELLAAHGLELSPAQVATLVRATGGWAAGLRLSALALQRGTGLDDLLRQLAAGHGDAADFVLAEVVDPLPATTKDLLLRTCLLDQVTGALADALTGRSDGTLTLLDLARTGTFVEPKPGFPSWFQYHEVLAGALQARLHRTRPALVPELHRTASRWLAAHDRLSDAVAHAAAAHDWSLAAREVVDDLAVGDLLVGLGTERLTELLAPMPPDGDDPHQALVQAALQMARFDADGCRRALDRAELTAVRLPSSEQPTLRLGICLVRVIASRLAADLPAAERAAAEARPLLQQVSQRRLEKHPELTALLFSSLGTLQLWLGSQEEAERSLAAGLSAAVGPTTAQPRTNCLGQLAMLHFLHGELRAANAGAIEALQLADRAGLSTAGRVPVGHLAAAAVAWDWHDLPAMRSHLEDAERSIGGRHDLAMALMTAVLRGRYQRAQHDEEEALRTLRAASGLRDQLPEAAFVTRLSLADEAETLILCGYGDEAEEVVRRLPAGGGERLLLQARLLLAAGRAAEAVDLLTALPPDGNVSFEVRSGVLRARALQERARGGDSAAAVAQLVEALEAARPEGLRRPFVDTGSWVRVVLERTPGLAARHHWLERAMGGTDEAPRRRDAVPALVVEPLTERELEILRLVAQPMTTREVAAVLHVSVNTVKTHLASVYRKLAASSRHEAVRRGRTLGLI